MDEKTGTPLISVQFPKKEPFLGKGKTLKVKMQKGFLLVRKKGVISIK